MFYRLFSNFAHKCIPKQKSLGDWLTKCVDEMKRSKVDTLQLFAYRLVTACNLDDNRNKQDLELLP